MSNNHFETTYEFGLRWLLGLWTNNYTLQERKVKATKNQDKTLQGKLFSLIDDYAKDDIYVVFTKILCGRNFCVW